MNERRLFLHTANRMEDLADMLARLLEGGRTDPFAEETVLVQSRGMGRWLSLHLAEAQGICFNVRFPFPRDVVEEILTALVPGWREGHGFRRETIVWQLFRLLEEFRNDRRFAAIARYLEENDLLKRIQLADRLGNLFDQYLMYRPDWLIRWEQGGDHDDWQAILWRRLAEEAEGELHLGHAWRALREMKAPNGGQPETLPSRMCIFGISSMPPLFLQVLQKYALHGELHLFLLQPTDQYWGDLVSKRKQARITDADSASPQYLEEGHPLVASLGRQGQDLLNLLIDHDFQQSDARESFTEACGTSLLNQIQTDILRLTDRESGDPEECGKLPVGETDSSIQVHSCHGPMREVEVLHDQLLDLFQKDPGLRPRDVLVMIPDIEAYAPYIQAVFGSAEDQRARIPFSVVDRRPRSAYHAIDAWFRLLDLAGSRFVARDVVGLLETPPFRARFGLSDRDVNTLRGWIQSTGIRWGIDAAHREEHALPPLRETTWQSGIEQWLLGYAMREQQGERTNGFHGLFPFDEVEGSNIELLNRFLSVLDFLFLARKKLAKPATLHDWCDRFSELLEDLFGGVDEVASETDAIRTAIGSLRQTSVRAKVKEAVSLDAIRYFFEKTIDETVASGGFLSGGVTFCTLQPMRTIPARAVCLLGMNDDAFPRRPQQLGFDRMRDERRVGDRSVREDDRYLFLETLLSARDTLLISYVGQSARDLSEAPPSVLVNELLDHLDRACSFPNEESAREFLVRRHRLQPFHPDYFSATGLFSYSSENAKACRRLMTERGEATPFVQAELPEPEPEWRTIPVQQLVRFFRNPSAFFVRERLGLRLPQDEAMLEDSEMFGMNPLDEYKIRTDAVEGLIEQREGLEWTRLQARGQAPLGTPGLAACDAIYKDAEKFVGRLSGVIDNLRERRNRDLDLRVGDFRFRGELGPFFDDKLVMYRPANLKPKDYLAAWIQHLASCGSAKMQEGGEPSTTVLIGKDDIVTLSPPEDADRLLETLLEFYWKGLREPLPFFPEAAWAYIQTRNGKKPAGALDAAWKKFAGDSNGFGRGEIEDPYVNLCWGGERMQGALNEEFEYIASTVFSAMEASKGTGATR